MKKIVSKMKDEIIREEAMKIAESLASLEAQKAAYVAAHGEDDFNMHVGTLIDEIYEIIDMDEGSWCEAPYGA